ncbi:MAG: HEAT repeat domain-containing protein [Firmicutes bacterium]|jgi:HEAT repeat protein|nr:HEAT repeat domain-containing protein [Bacillota bacterium]MDH7495564.1 HEAT repeat domain-containing protein [Bacillota bacterium]
MRVLEKTDRIDVLIHQLTRLEEDLDKLDGEGRDQTRAEVAAVRGQIVDVLMAALREGDVFARRGAAYGLSKLPEARAVDVLIYALEDPDDSVRSWAAEALGSIGDERALGPLVRSLKEENPYVAYSITHAIMKFPKNEVARAVMAASDSADRNVRRRAAKLLGELKYKKAVPRLATMLSDADPQVRYEATEALRKVGDIRALEHLIAALADESTDVRYGAIQALRALGDRRAVEPLVRVCMENEDLRFYALQALKELCGEDAVRPVLEALDHLRSVAHAVAIRVLNERDQGVQRASG